MKKIALSLIGCFPLLLGYVLYLFLMRNYMPPVLIIGLVVLTVWFIVSMFSIKLVRKKSQAILLLNAPAFLVLLLLLLQILVSGHYWLHPIGFVTQLFYLPLTNLSMSILQIVIKNIDMFYTEVFAFILLLLISYFGRVVGEHQR